MEYVIKVHKKDGTIKEFYPPDIMALGILVMFLHDIEEDFEILDNNGKICGGQIAGKGLAKNPPSHEA
jgi:hypothetical protein